MLRRTQNSALSTKYSIDNLKKSKRRKSFPHMRPLPAYYPGRYLRADWSCRAWRSCEKCFCTDTIQTTVARTQKPQMMATGRKHSTPGRLRSTGMASTGSLTALNHSFMAVPFQYVLSGTMRHRYRCQGTTFELVKSHSLLLRRLQCHPNPLHRLTGRVRKSN